MKLGPPLGLADREALGPPLGLAEGEELGPPLGPPLGAELGLGLGYVLFFMLGLQLGEELGIELFVVGTKGSIFPPVGLFVGVGLSGVATRSLTGSFTHVHLISNVYLMIPYPLVVYSSYGGLQHLSI
jgi:hypothetical protein